MLSTFVRPAGSPAALTCLTQLKLKEHVKDGQELPLSSTFLQLLPLLPLLVTLLLLHPDGPAIPRWRRAGAVSSSLA